MLRQVRLSAARWERCALPGNHANIEEIQKLLRSTLSNITIKDAHYYICRVRFIPLLTIWTLRGINSSQQDDFYLNVICHLHQGRKQK
jgi:hypothetical protein